MLWLYVSCIKDRRNLTFMLMFWHLKSVVHKHFYQGPETNTKQTTDPHLIRFFLTVPHLIRFLHLYVLLQKVYETHDQIINTLCPLFDGDPLKPL